MLGAIVTALILIAIYKTQGYLYDTTLLAGVFMCYLDLVRDILAEDNEYSPYSMDYSMERLKLVIAVGVILVAILSAVILSWIFPQILASVGGE